MGGHDNGANGAIRARDAVPHTEHEDRRIQAPDGAESPTQLHCIPHRSIDDPRPGSNGAMRTCLRRYHVSLCRSIFLGEPPTDVRVAEEALLEGIRDGIEAAWAGNIAGDVVRAFNAVLAKHGGHLSDDAPPGAGSGTSRRKLAPATAQGPSSILPYDEKRQPLGILSPLLPFTGTGQFNLILLVGITFQVVGILVHHDTYSGVVY